ncbi:uncharacterized protein LOC128237266 [Mya arenaria]|uniref:uncharacterized protein LOC128237266 n=1 Tax=Mya arenaria TaxID=6604 RepID=UPI0022DFC0B6|nr:uncharacterized protein LOC128237266 [Mya arenaria]
MAAHRNNNDLDLITMNADGPHIAGNASKRKNAILNLVTRRKPHLIFFQEYKLAMNLWKRDEIKRKYTYIGSNGNSASILYDKNKLTCTSSFYTQKQTEGQGVIQWYPTINHEDVDLINFINSSLDINEHRLCMSKMTRKDVEPVQHFICISWHGPHRVTDPNKVIVLNKLLQTANGIFTEFNIPVIIGGDFNISNEEVDQ